MLWYVMWCGVVWCDLMVNISLPIFVGFFFTPLWSVSHVVPYIARSHRTPTYASKLVIAEWQSTPCLAIPPALGVPSLGPKSKIILGDLVTHQMRNRCTMVMLAERSKH